MNIPTIAPGLDDQEELEKRGNQNEIKKGNIHQYILYLMMK